MTVLLSVIIPVYRDWERLARCLDALQRQSLDSARFEIVLANNDAESSPPPFALPDNVRVVHEPRPGSYVARNTAVAASRGKYLAFTDSDCVPLLHWLAEGLAALETDPESRITGPIPVFREPDASYFAFVYEFHGAFNQLRAVDYGRCATANLFVAREVFDRVGPFDPSLLSGGDTEWGDRAQKLGVPILYRDGVAVAHPARTTLSDIIRKRRRIAGSVAQRKGYPTHWYVLFKLLPPVRSYSKEIYASGRGRVGFADKIILFFVHWATRVAEALEFLAVRMNWKRPNRT